MRCANALSRLGRIASPAIALAASIAVCADCSRAQDPSPTVIAIDARAGVHPISPYIYGTCFASPEQLKALNFTINRYGGNASTRYNWRVNSYNSGADWYYESTPRKDRTPAKEIDDIVAADRALGVQTMVTVPMIGWVAKVGPTDDPLYSFPVSKYGPQQRTDPQRPDAGNGIRPNGDRIVNANPNDANVPSDPAFERAFVEHEIKKWGRSDRGGVRYYLMDNEPGIWQETHLDVHPNGPTSKEIADDIIAYGTMVKSVDPHALVVGPEEWGWGGWVWSGDDKQHGALKGPDRAARGGIDNVPAILRMIHEHDVQAGKRTLDVLTCHLYPQGIDGNDVSAKAQLLRNRNTRQIWDRNYVDESWINEPVMLIPRMKDAVAAYYPGTLIGITEYNWGAEGNIGGATAQADVLGIFGREGLDYATRWTTPGMDTPTFKAMQMYRNYDGRNGAFGETSVSADAPSPDTLSAFAAVRKSDRALTVMVIDKDLAGTSPVDLALTGFSAGAQAQVWQLTSSNAIRRLGDVPVAGGHVAASLPPQSITLFVIPSR